MTKRLDPNATTKWCNKCKKEKPLGEFGIRSRHKNPKPVAWCKPCCREHNKLKARELLKTPEGYRRATIAQRRNRGVVNPTGEMKSGPCDICGRIKEKLDFDHDHPTGEFRGWLCKSCNWQIEWFLRYAQQVLKYAERWRIDERL